jgi:hypothetical protein
MTCAQARHAARLIAGRDAVAGKTRDRDDFLRELRAYAAKMGWPVIKRRTNARAYGRYLEYCEEFKPRFAGDVLVACTDCTLPVKLVEGDAGYEGNGEATRDGSDWTHDACLEARCPDCGERAGVNCAHRRTEALSA